MTTRLPYRYGSGFVDRATGLRFEGHHPSARPDRWRGYIEGAIAEYERYGLGHLVDRHALDRADGVSLFFTAVDHEERVVAGFRCHGPLDSVEESQALAEMATSPEVGEHRSALKAVTPYGVVELKGAWRRLSGSKDRLIATAFSHCAVHALEWLGAEMALGAVADRMYDPLAAVGARMMGTESAPFPSEKYRTILMAWRRPAYGQLVEPAQAALIREEAASLRRGPDPGTVTGWRPIVLDVARRADRQILANLRADPGIEMLDVVERQRTELARLLPAPEPELLEEPPLHVYYPWRRTVVRMLGRRAFPVVRLDRNRNRITREEQRRLRAQRVGVVGLSTGHSAATTIVLEGLCGELRLADFDDIELTNLNRLPATVLDVGLNKAVVAARRVAEIDPYLPVEIAPHGLTMDNVEEFVAGLDVVVEECDEIDMKLAVREVARRHRVPVVMETSDRGLLDVERFDQEPDRPIFHGLLDGVTATSVRAMSLLEKLPHIIRLVGPAQGSARGAASLAEIGRTLSTWPQLGADVTLGGAAVAAAVRRLGLGEAVPSGRVRVDLEALVGSIENPERPPDHGGDEPPEPAPVPADPLLAVAHAATLAPSGGNAQPWRFAMSDDALDFELDRSRSSLLDVRSRGSYVALGAALFNARVAAAATGRLGPVTYFPDGPTSDVVATLHLGDGTDPVLAALYPGVLARCVNRRRGTPEPFDLSLAAALGEAAAAEGAALHLVTDRERLAQCADVLAASERIRFLTPALHREMMHELRWPGEDVRTGIDIRTLELGAFELATLDVVRRSDVMELLDSWDAGQALGDSARGSVLSSSALAVVTLPSASATSYLRGGAAVERVWVCAQQAGLGVQPVSPIFVFAVQQADFEELGGTRWAGELRTLAERFRTLVHLGPTSVTALVLRLSHAEPPSARSIRLPVEAVLRRRGSPPGPVQVGRDGPAPAVTGPPEWPTTPQSGHHGPAAGAGPVVAP